MDKIEGFLLAATGIYQFKQFHFIKNFSSKNIYQEAEFKITNKFKTIWKAENGLEQWENQCCLRHNGINAYEKYYLSLVCYASYLGGSETQTISIISFLKSFDFKFQRRNHNCDILLRSKHFDISLASWLSRSSSVTGEKSWTMDQSQVCLLNIFSASLHHFAMRDRIHN